MKTTNLFRKSLFVIVTMILFPLWGQQPVFKNLKLIRQADFKIVKKTTHPVALRAIRRGEKPGAFKGVKTQFKPSVKILPKQKAVMVQKKMKKGFLMLQAVKQVQLNPGGIYFNPESRTVFQAYPIGKDTLALVQPPFDAVIKDFKIPPQTVKINIANTSYVVKGATVREKRIINTRHKGKDEVVNDTGYLLQMEFNGGDYEFNKEIKTDNGTTNISLKLNLKGHLYLKNPEIKAKYTAKDGYSFSVKLNEDADIEAELKASLKSEIEIPLWSFDIPAGEYGSCKVGIYAFIDMKGKVSLSYKIEQNFSIEAGLKGDTFAYYPKSYEPIIDVRKSIKSGYTFDGKIKAFGGIEAIAKIIVLDYNLGTVTAKAGPEVELKSVDNGKNLEAKAGVRFNITAKVIKIDKTFTLYDKYYLLWEYKKKNYGGLIMMVKSADAYNDRVWGEIYKEKDSIPHKCNLKILVKHNGRIKNTYATSTDENGIFAIENVPLVKGDSVQIHIDGIPNNSLWFPATLPFENISLFYADYYTNKLEGSIASKIDLFPKQKSKSTTHSNPVKHNNPVRVEKNISGNKLIFGNGIKIAPILFKNAIKYHGDIEVIITPSFHKATLNIPAVDLRKKKKRYKHNKRNRRNNRNNSFNSVNQNINKNFNNSVKQNVNKNIKSQETLQAINNLIKKKVIHLPFDAFIVKNVDIKPYDRVKVRLNIDGFVLESNEVIADGLIITPTVDVDKQGGIKSPEIKASDSYVIVNALRSDVTPTGKIRLLKGIDMKHSQPHKDFPNQEFTFPRLKMFPQAVRPLVYYDITTDLKPTSQKGFAEAHTGAWHVNNIFYDRKHVVQLQKFDGHRFEFIGYTYDNMSVSYKYYQKTCAMDKDIIGKINKSNMPGKNMKGKMLQHIH